MQKHKQWLLIAHDDLKASKILCVEKLITIASYHTQQCVEKALKGFLALHKQPPRKTHDLIELTKICMQFDVAFGVFLSTAVELSPYATAGRYPESGVEPLSSDDIQRAIQEAEHVLHFVEQQDGL